MTVTLQVEGLHFAYAGAPPLLTDVSFELLGGQTVCLLGPNGSGKTTLMRCVLGLETLAAGRVRVDGQDLAAWSPKRRAQHMAYVPQSSAVAFPFTVFDVVLMGRSAHLRFMADPDDTDRRKASQALDRLQILHLHERLFEQLSGGERQLVLLARALAQQARLLVMDEPCAALDLGHQVQVLQAMHSLVGEGYAILLSTHLPEQAFALQAQVALLAQGRLRGPAPAADMLTAAALSGLYGTPVDLLKVSSGPARGQQVCVPVLGTRPRGTEHESTSTDARRPAGDSDRVGAGG